MSKYNDTPNWRRQTRTPPAKSIHIVDMNGLVKIPYREKTKKTEQSHRKDAVIRIIGGIFFLGCSIYAMWLFLHVSLHVSGWHGVPLLLLAASLLLLSIFISIKGTNPKESDKNIALAVITTFCIPFPMFFVSPRFVEWVAGKPCFYMLPNGDTEPFYIYLAACLVFYSFGLVFGLGAVIWDKEEDEEENEPTVYLCHCKECGYVGRISYYKNRSYNGFLGEDIWNCPKCNWNIERSEIVHCDKEDEEREMDKIKRGGAK